MKHKILISIFSLFLLLSFGSVEQILACMCVEYTPQQVYNFADLVFVGKPIDDFAKLEKQPNGNYYVASSFTITTFEVKESFWGINKGEIVKVNSGFLGYCGFGVRFFSEVDYLIYAIKHKDGSYTTRSCYRTSCINCKPYNTEKDLEFLRNVLPQRKTATFSGRVMPTISMEDQLFLDDIPFTDVKIKIKDLNDNQKVFFTKSNDKGIFSIELPEGHYQAEVEIPKGRQLSKLAKEKIESIKLRKGGEVNLFIDLEKVK